MKPALCNAVTRRQEISSSKEENMVVGSKHNLEPFSRSSVSLNETRKRMKERGRKLILRQHECITGGKATFTICGH
jgi:hypothetical protein